PERRPGSARADFASCFAGPALFFSAKSYPSPVPARKSVPSDHSEGTRRIRGRALLEVSHASSDAARPSASPSGPLGRPPALSPTGAVAGSPALYQSSHARSTDCGRGHAGGTLPRPERLKHGSPSEPLTRPRGQGHGQSTGRDRMQRLRNGAEVEVDRSRRV